MLLIPRSYQQHGTKKNYKIFENNLIMGMVPPPSASACNSQLGSHPAQR